VHLFGTLAGGWEFKPELDMKIRFEFVPKNTFSKYVENLINIGHKVLPSTLPKSE